MIRSQHVWSLIGASSGKACIALLSIVTAVIVAQYFGQVGLGVFALLRVMPTIFMVITDPGFSHAIPYLSGNKKVPIATLIGSSLVVYFGIGMLQVIIWLILSPIIHENLLSQIDIQYMYIAAVLPPMQSITIVIVNLLRVFERFNLANGVFICAEVGLIFAVLLLPNIADISLNSIILALIFSGGFSILIGMFFIRAVSPEKGIIFSKSIAWEGIIFGIKSQVGNAFQILNYRLDHLLLGWFLSAEKVAVYFVATKSIEFFRFFTTSIVFVFEPILASQKADGAKARVKKMFFPLLAANGVLIAIGVLVAPFLYPILFGDWSSDAKVPLLILATGLAISGGNSLFGAYFLGQGAPGITTLASACGLIITVILAPILIPLLEIPGAAITSSVAYTVVTTIYIFIFAFHSQERPSN